MPIRASQGDAVNPDAMRSDDSGMPCFMRRQNEPRWVLCRTQRKPVAERCGPPREKPHKALAPYEIALLRPATSLQCLEFGCTIVSIHASAVRLEDASIATSQSTTE